MLTEMVSAVIEHGASNLQDLTPSSSRPLAEVFVFVGTIKKTTNVWGGVQHLECSFALTFMYLFLSTT